MRERKECEFFLIRYVPDAVRMEFVNIGVLLREAGGHAVQGPMLRFTRDWSRVRCTDPEVDIEMLEALETELQERLLKPAQDGVKPMLEVIEDSFSNMVQITESKGCLAESMIAELENLFRVYVEPQRQKGTSGRSAIHATMRGQFERGRVWDLMQKRVAAAQYTRPGDPLRIDCAYRPNGVIRMFHAVSLERDPGMAKVLAFTMPELRAGVADVELAKLELTAIVEPLVQVKEGAEENEDATSEYRFAVETMEARAIRVMTTNDLPHIVETAQRELRA